MTLVVLIFMVHRMRIWSIACVRQNWMVVLIFVVRIITGGVCCQRMFLMGRWLVGLLVVLVMMLLRVYCVVVFIVVGRIERVVLIELFIVTK